MNYLENEEIVSIEKAIITLTKNVNGSVANGYLFYEREDSRVKRNNFRKLMDYMVNHGLVDKREGATAPIIKLTPFGYEIAQIGFQNYYHNKQQQNLEDYKTRRLEMEKLQYETELAKLNLTDYHNTKRFARWGFWIALLALLLQIVSLIFKADT